MRLVKFPLLVGVFIANFLIGQAWGATQYIDGNLAGTCAGGAGTSYRVAERDCGGSDGTKAYVDPKTAFESNNVAKGDTVYFRAGTYSPSNSIVSAFAAGTGGTTIISNYAGESPVWDIANTAAQAYNWFLQYPATISGLTVTNTGSAAKNFMSFGAATITLSGNSFDYNNTANQNMFVTNGACTVTLSGNTIQNVKGASSYFLTNASSGATVTLTANKVNNINTLIRGTGAATSRAYNNTIANAASYVFLFSTNANVIADIKRNIIVLDTGSSVRAVYAADVVSAAWVSTPANFTFENNIIYKESITNNSDYDNLLYGETYLVSAPKSNRYINPGFTNYAGGDYTLTATSYAAARGSGATGNDFNGEAFNSTDVGCFKNPFTSPLALALSGKVAFVGDSIMLGTGATAGNEVYTKFQTLSGVPVESTGVAISGLKIEGLRFFVDKVAVENYPSVMMVGIGVNNMLSFSPSNATNQQLADEIKIVFNKIAEYGITPIWLGCGSVTGNPPDNTTHVKDFNSKVDANCASNGWRYGSWLWRSELNTDWKTTYYADLTTNVHPNNAGHLMIASLAENLYRNRTSYWVAAANVDSLQAATYQHPLTTTQFNAIADGIIADGTKARQKGKYIEDGDELIPKFYRKQ